jgi:arsenate reductase (thioredoxin)
VTNDHPGSPRRPEPDPQAPSPPGGLCLRPQRWTVRRRAAAHQHYAADRVIALSAGTQPGERVHPELVDALAKLGLDTSREHPKLLTRETIATSDLAITLGCGEECPYVPGVTYRDWPVEDPAGQNEETVRRIVADLDSRVRALLVDLVPDLELKSPVVDRTV